MNANRIENQSFDEERALYALRDTEVVGCSFAGPHDGESVLKEAHGISMSNCSFSLRYPLWHLKDFSLDDVQMDDLARAALWYCQNGRISRSNLAGIKALRECCNVTISDCKIESPEFGWKCDDIVIKDSQIDAKYIFLDSHNVRLDRVQMTGKYSFQYMENLEIVDSTLDTKDAFWHSRNITVRNCVVKGEYLGWFSDGLTLIDCQILGTQPLCYCENLVLENCTMEDCDLAFEYSDVHADVVGNIPSIKNPKSGIITVDSVGEIIQGGAVMDCSGQVVIRQA